MKKERLFFRFVMVMAVLWSFSSCEKDDEKAPDFMDVDHTSFVFSGAAQDSFLMVSSSLAWKATTDVDWITLTPSSGTGGNVQVKVSVTENGVTEERTGKITIDGFEKKTIPVTQKQMSVSTLWETPTVEGELANGINIEGVTISIPFSGESEYVIPEITITSSIGGLSIKEMKDVQIMKGVGELKLTLQGKPETSGNAEITINGIPGLEENVITIPVVEPVVWGDMALVGTLRHKEPILYQYLEIVYENGSGRELELTFKSSVTGISLAQTKYKLEEGKDTLRMMLKGTPESSGMAELIVSGLVHKGSDTVRTEIGKADVLTRYGNLTYEGPDLYVGEECTGKLILPYEAVSDAGVIEYTNVTAKTSDEGVKVAVLEKVTVDEKKGQIELALSGTPTQVGEITFVFEGIPGLENKLVKLNVTNASQFTAIWNAELYETDLFNNATWTIVPADEGYEQPSLVRMSEVYTALQGMNPGRASGAFGGPANSTYAGVSYNMDDPMNPSYWISIFIKPQPDYTISLDELSFYCKTPDYAAQKISVQYKIAHMLGGAKAEPEHCENNAGWKEIATFDRKLIEGSSDIWEESKINLSSIPELQNIEFPEDEGSDWSDRRYYLVFRIVPYAEKDTWDAPFGMCMNAECYITKPDNTVDHFIKITGTIN